MSDMADAIRFFYSGNLEEAENILEEIIKEDRHNINALVRYGAVLEGLDKLREAGEIYTRLAHIYFHETSYQECLDALENAIRYLPEAGGLSLLKGNCLYRMGRYREALPYFTEAPRNAENQFYIGKILFALKQYSEALKVFSSIKAKSTNKEESFLANYWMGKSLYTLCRFDEAIPCLESYMKSYPMETQVYLDLALCFLDAGNLNEAEKHLIKYQDMCGNFNLANLYLGIVNCRKGDHNKAIEYLEETPASEQSLHWKGLAYYGLGLYEEAISCFAEIDKVLNDPFYLKLMGSAHLKLGNYYEAKMLFEKALAESPQDQELDKLLAITGHYLTMANMPDNWLYK